MRRPEFTPRIWHSEDGRWTYRMDKHGITDICPGPKHRLMQWLRAENFYFTKTVKKPFEGGSDHDHWAF